jgi:hypothetical protein
LRSTAHTTRRKKTVESPPKNYPVGRSTWWRRAASPDRTPAAACCISGCTSCPWIRWWVRSCWCSCTQREKQLHLLHHGASSALTQERIENQKRMRTQLRRRTRTVQRLHTTDIVPPHLNLNSILRHTSYLIGSLWRVTNSIT